MANRNLRTLKIRFSGADLRTAKFENRDHLVVPVVALMEGVIHAVNAATPELVTAAELKKAPKGWNGRPVVMDHPQEGGQRVSANDPKVLEKNAFGMLFNTEVKDNKLVTEAWLDPMKAEKIPEAKDTINRIRNGEAVEVSVGVFVNTEKTSGEFEGSPYEAIWKDIVPDHLAMLPKGVEGACSVDMGCGAPRAASSASPKKEEQSLWDRLKNLVKFRSGQDDDVSDVDRRVLLENALRKVEPGFLWVEAVFPETVVFATELDTYQLFEQGYSIEEGTVDLTGDKQEVKPVTRFEPVTAKKKGDVNMDLKDRVKALIDNPKSAFTSADAEYLEGVGEERLAAFEKSLVEEPAPEPEPEPEPEPVQEEKTEDQILSELPVAMQQVFKDHKAAQAKKKSDLVDKLKTAQSEFTECELKAMSTVELERLAKLINIATPQTTDYSLQNAPRAAEGDGVPEAKKLSDHFRTAAQK